MIKETRRGDHPSPARRSRIDFIAPERIGITDPQGKVTDGVWRGGLEIRLTSRDGHTVARPKLADGFVRDAGVPTRHMESSRVCSSSIHCQAING
jgi:hypothetical protein